MSGDTPLLTVPNISEGRDRALVELVTADPSLIDLHVDPDHNRSVATYAGDPDKLVDAMTRLVERAIEHLDLGPHTGAHPRFGVVDVMPFVPYDADIAIARGAADRAATAIEDRGVPVHRYGDGAVELPVLRRTLREPHDAHPTAGVVCIGVRGPLVAFNVNLRATLTEARRIAATLRGPHVQALGFALPSRELAQVSMNLIDPRSLGPMDAFERIEQGGTEIVDAEIVGLLPDGLETTLAGIPLRTPVRTVGEALGRPPSHRSAI